MADYYSLLARAVANLPKTSPAPARAIIYERARAALVTQLRSLRPPLPEVDIAREESALNAAIEKIETQFAQSPAPDAARENSPAAPPKPAAPPAPAPPRPAVPPAPRPTAGASAAPGAPAPTAPPARAATAAVPPRPTPASAAPAQQSPRPAAPPSPSAPPNAPPRPAAASPSAAAAPGAPRPIPAPRAPAASALAAAHSAPAPAARPADAPRPAPLAPRPAPPPAPNVVASSARSPLAARSAAAPPVVARRDESGETQLAPPITAGEEERVGPAARSDSEAIRPAAPVRAEPRSARAWPLVALAVVIGLVGAIAVAAVIMRQKPQDLAVVPPASGVGESAAMQPAAKLSERVQSASPQAQQPAPPSTPSSGASAPAPSEGAAAPPSEASSPSSAPAPAAAPSTAAAPAASPQAEAQSSAPAATSQLAVAARAAMLVASPDDPQKPAINLGSVVWSAIPPNPNQPATIGVMAEADVPDLKLHVVMTLRKNFDATLQATHTIDLKFTLADGSPIKGVKDIGLPQMRKEGSNADETLTGGRVKINDLYFLIGLWGGDADVARNADLISTRAWFDFPLLLLDGRIAKLVLQKSPQGEEILKQAFAAWK